MHDLDKIRHQEVEMERNEDGKLELVRPDNSFTDEAGLSGCEVN